MPMFGNTSFEMKSAAGLCLRSGPWTPGDVPFVAPEPLSQVKALNADNCAFSSALVAKERSILMEGRVRQTQPLATLKSIHVPAICGRFFADVVASVGRS